MKIKRKEFIKQYLNKNVKNIDLKNLQSYQNTTTIDKMIIKYHDDNASNGSTKMTEKRVIELIHEHVPPMIKSAISEVVTEMKNFMVELIKPISERLDRIEQRLDRVKQDIKDIKHYPTIKNELSLK